MIKTIRNSQTGTKIALISSTLLGGLTVKSLISSVRRRRRNRRIASA